MSEKEILILSCNAGKAFTQRLFDCIKDQDLNDVTTRLINSEEVWFANGEVKTVLNESVRRKEVFVIQMMQDPSTQYSINDNLLALFSAVDALRLSDVSEVNVMIPQFPYSRQERRKSREGVTAKLCAKFLEETGADRIFSFDIHSEAIAGFFDKANLANIRASHQLIGAIRQFYPTNDFVVVSPDIGGVEYNNYYAKKFGNSLAVMHKTRNYSSANTVDQIRLIGDVSGKDVLIVDDIIDSGGTIIKACQTLKEENAKNILLACTFPFFTSNAAEKLDKAYQEGIFNHLIGTDAVLWGEQFKKDHPWYQEVSVAPLCLKLMLKIFSKESLITLSEFI